VSNYIVGLTGGIGSGKTTVAELFVNKGVSLVDTDAIAHELTGPGGEAMPAVVAKFGAALVNADGALNRAAMRQRVFADPAARVQLEEILHPRIRQIAAERCQAAESPYVVLAVPLLIESGMYRERCHRILVVDCPESRQIERVMARNGMSLEQVKAIIAAQATRQQRLAVADDVVVNDADLASLSGQVDALHSMYLRLSSEIAKAKC
jgi:dephospho-CoA kinase